jgi:hypothetical protein
LKLQLKNPTITKHIYIIKKVKINMITKIYKINNSNKKELNQICELFANNFVSEPQYQKLSKNPNKIKELIKIQTKNILQNPNNSIEIYSPSNKLQSIIILINTNY